MLLIREIDTTHPASGNVKFHVLHSIAGQGPIDVYMGGTSVNKRGVSELPYLSLSTPFEVVDYDARAAIIVSGANCLSVVAPPTFNPADTLLTIWLYNLALE